ncbi:hypothetical protein OG21DRAFT_1427867, partial [Imleria badia]
HHHIPYKKQVPFISTESFVSIRALCGRQQSHRDNLESLAYVLIYLLCGSLPWQDSSETSDELLVLTVFSLQKGPAGFLCISHICTLTFFDLWPDYDYMRKIFNDVHSRTESGD